MNSSTFFSKSRLFHLVTVISLCLLGIVCFAGCGPEDDLDISTSSLSFSSEGEKKSFSITANVNWTVSSSEASWLTFSSTSGSKDGTIEVSAASNTATSERVAIITVSGGDIVRAISVTQAAAPPTTSVSTTSLNFKQEGEVKTVLIESNTNWIIRYDEASWFTVSPTSGSNDETITITASPYTDVTSERTAILTISSGNQTQTITLTQAGIPTVLNVSETSLSVSPVKNANSFYPVQIESNTDWTVAKGAETWLSVSPTSGSGNGRIAIKVEDNQTESERTATITVSGGNITRTIKVRQPAPSLTISKTSLNFAVAGGQQTFTINANVSLIDWTVTSSVPSWLTVSPESGSFTKTITVTAKANTSTSERTATITVTGAGITRTIQVIQEKSTYLNVTPTALSYTYEGGAKTLNITSNANWTINKGSATWLTLSVASGSNNKSVSVTATANTSSSKRSATITISGADITRTIQVSQPGVSLDVSSSSLSFSSSGEQKTVDVTSNVKWTVTKSSATWLTVSPTSGSNNGRLTLRAAANTTSSERSATVTVSGGDRTRDVRVTQRAAFAGPGSVTFWVSKDFLCGPISVTLKGQGTKTITKYYIGGTPGCGADGTATFTNLPGGTYTYTASCSGKQWSGSVTLDYSCNRVKLE